MADIMNLRQDVSLTKYINETKNKIDKLKTVKNILESEFDAKRKTLDDEMTELRIEAVSKKFDIKVGDHVRGGDWKYEEKEAGTYPGTNSDWEILEICPSYEIEKKPNLIVKLIKNKNGGKYNIYDHWFKI